MGDEDISEKNQYKPLKYLTLSFHVIMFFCIVYIQNLTTTKDMSIKRAFHDLSSESAPFTVTGQGS